MLTRFYQALWSADFLQRMDNRFAKILCVKLYNKLKHKNLVDHHYFLTDFFKLRYFGDLYNLIDRRVYRHGAFEPHILFLIRDILTTQVNPIFLDIGCNVGQHSLFASQYANQVHAFDPFPQVLERLEKNISINQLKNIRIHQVGVGAANEEKKFFLPPETNLGKGSFVEDFNAANQQGPTFKIVNGDEYLQAQHVDNFQLIKIDVEGFEKAVLLGLQNTLERLRPSIIMEVTKNISSSFQNSAELMKLLPPNYSCLLINKARRKHYSLKTLDWNAFKSQVNVLLLPQDLMDQIVIRR